MALLELKMKGPRNNYDLILAFSPDNDKISENKQSTNSDMLLAWLKIGRVMKSEILILPSLSFGRSRQTPVTWKKFS